MMLHEAAMKYVGVPFRHRGRSIRGVDCIGLIICAARDTGYDEGIKYKRLVYGREPTDALLQEALKEHFGDPVDRPPQLGDVILMRLRHMKEPSHVGIIAPHPHGLGVIHAYGEIRKVVLQRINSSMRERIVGVYEWPHKS
jgi:cell wall-associated NlpC family hydrolase